MTLRTPNPFSNTQTLLDLQRVKERMAILNQQITTGKRIVRPGDDPTGAALLVDFRNSISRNDQYVRQMESASAFLQATETSLTGVSDNLIRLMEMATQATGAPTTTVRQALIPEAQGILSNLLSLANWQDQGKYIFAGTRTTTKPFPDAVTWSGDFNAISLEYSMGASVKTNLTGDAVFFGSGGQGSATDVFEQVSDFITGLQTNDSTMIQGAFDNIKTIFPALQNQIAELGGRQASLIQMKSTMETFTASLQSIQESYEAVDYPEAITEYEHENIAQQAALSVLSKSSAQNLFNYLT